MKACHVRGLDTTNISSKDLQIWLQSWLDLSKHISGIEVISQVLPGRRYILKDKGNDKERTFRETVNIHVHTIQPLAMSMAVNSSCLKSSQEWHSAQFHDVRSLSKNGCFHVETCGVHVWKRKRPVLRRDIFNTVILQANFVNNCSFWVQNCKYRVPQDFQYRNTAIFQGKYRNTVRKIS